MKFGTAVVLLSISLFLPGCAQRYKVTMTNGNVITAHSKPRLNAERSAYSFKDAAGNVRTVPTGRVTEIEAQ